MRNIDIKCPECDEIVIDHFQRRSDEELPVCTACHVRMERVYLPTRRGNVIGDDIPGGIDIKHGICWPDGTPRRYYSKSEMKKEADRLGVYNKVEHRPIRGSDKSKHTTRWI